jgi:hypothetical protein
MASRDAAHDAARAASATQSLAGEVLRTAPFGLCALLLAAFVASPYLPMVDFPQHAAQIAVWLRLDDPAFSYSKVFELCARRSRCRGCERRCECSPLAGSSS